MGGHVFVVRSDLRRLSCDAWLVPTDTRLAIEHNWWEAIGGPPDHVQPPADWRVDGRRTFLLDDTVPGGPQAWATNVGSMPGRDPAWFVEGATQFVDEAAAALAGVPSRNRRARPLLALPAVGTGAGGAAAEYGALLEQLLGGLRDSAAEHDVDVALVTFDEAAFAAAQWVRRDWPATCWDLSDELHDEANRLGREARLGRLVLFLGAGVSMGAGLPSWSDLLDQLAVEAGLDAKEREALARISEVDRARIVADRLAAQGERLGDVIGRRLAGSELSLAHVLLAGLPVGEAATMNYDDRFEQATRAAGADVRVLPYEPGADADRWLLKLHGSIDHPDDIVLTREDYLRYADRRAALAGIVQALLITRHMLFVGFSLTDENFHRMVDEVRKAVRTPGDDGRRFGSALLLEPDPLLAELWDEDLVPIGFRGSEPGSGPAARQLEIFLDRLLLAATDNTDHLMDPRFDGVLSDEERELRDVLSALARAADGRSTPPWQPVHDLLGRFGG